MKVEKIIFMQTFPTGLYANEKLGIEIQITDNDYISCNDNEAAVVGVAFETAKKYVTESFKKLNPTTLPPEPYNQPPPVIQVEKIDDTKTLDEQIRSCTELNVLHSYKFIVKGKPEEKTYLEMLEKLQKQ